MGTGNGIMVVIVLGLLCLSPGTKLCKEKEKLFSSQTAETDDFP